MNSHRPHQLTVDGTGWCCFNSRQKSTGAIYSRVCNPFNRLLIDNMDRSTKSYIDQLVAPLLARIDSLERSNQALTLQVRHLESLLHNDRPYQRPTVSAANHMRDSRLSSRDGDNSLSKKPGWNRVTKIEPSPARESRENTSIDKTKLKPPIPKMVRSPNKVDSPDELISSRVEKKVSGGVKMHTEGSESDHTLPPRSDPHLPPKHPEPRADKPADQPTTKQPLPAVPPAAGNKFEQLVKSNNQIMSGLKQGTEKARDPLAATAITSNYVEKVVSPKSEQTLSHTNSPNERSFISEQALVGAAKVGECKSGG